MHMFISLLWEQDSEGPAVEAGGQRGGLCSDAGRGDSDSGEVGVGKVGGGGPALGPKQKSHTRHSRGYEDGSQA